MEHESMILISSATWFWGNKQIAQVSVAKQSFPKKKGYEAKGH